MLKGKNLLYLLKKYKRNYTNDKNYCKVKKTMSI